MKTLQGEGTNIEASLHITTKSQTPESERIEAKEQYMAKRQGKK